VDAGQQTGARRTANRRIAGRIQEGDTRLPQALDIRRDRFRNPAESGQGIVEIIAQNKENIRPIGLALQERDWQEPCGKKEKEGGHGNMDREERQPKASCEQAFMQLR